MLNIRTFDARAGGNTVYKALAHPLADEAAGRLRARLAGPVAVYDPEGLAEAALALLGLPADMLLVHDSTAVGQVRAGLTARALTDLPTSGARTVLIAAFGAARAAERIRPMLPQDAAIETLDAIRLPDALLTNRASYLDKLNFATNFAFFRDADGLSTRLVSANYWANHGAGSVRLWLRLYDAAGAALATWEEALPPGPGGFAIDSRDVRRRFGLPEFAGQLFVHAVGAAGHDVVKYALDTFSSGDGPNGGPSLSCTHDANAWPADRYAGLPAPRADEKVVFWLQNSHATPIPAGAVALDRMGADAPVPYPRAIGPFASVPIDVESLLPGLRWPAQIEIRAGRHVVRPRYEVVQGGRTRIAHPNVERDNLSPDPAIASLPAAMGRGFLLPFPILPKARFRTVALPTPMATTQADLPVRIDAFDRSGTKRGEMFVGRLPRDHAVDVDLDALDVEEGHAELVYDFRDGGGADGWLHGLFRYEDRAGGHAAETSFGAHIFNTAMTWKDEPQSYNGPPPGLTTRLFLKLGDAEGRESFCVLIYPASGPWHPVSDTRLILHDGAGRAIAEAKVAIPLSGSVDIRPARMFAPDALRAAADGGYVLIRDTTCRLFGYHGLADAAGRFSLDHMFGF